MPTKEPDVAVGEINSFAVAGDFVEAVSCFVNSENFPGSPARIAMCLIVDDLTLILDSLARRESRYFWPLRSGLHHRNSGYKAAETIEVPTQVTGWLSTVPEMNYALVCGALTFAIDKLKARLKLNSRPK